MDTSDSRGINHVAAVVLAAAFLVIAFSVLATAASAQVDPRTYEGVYTVNEADLNQTRCEPNPFRKALAAGQPGPSYQYRVRVTTAAGRVSFSPESSNVSLFSADLTADGKFSAGSGTDYSAVGEFVPAGFRMTWVVPQGAGNCTTEFRTTGGVVGGGAQPGSTTAPPASKKSGSPTGTIVVIGGITAGTVTILVLVNGKKVRRRPKFKPRGKTATGPLNVFDATEEQQRQRWNKDQKVWDPETKTFRDPRPEDLIDEPDWEPEVTKTLKPEDVPSPCRDLYDRYVYESEQAHWVEQAIKDSEARHKKLEKLFQQNRLRAAAQIGLEIVGGVAAITEGLVGGAGSSLLRAAKAPLRPLEDAVRRRDSLLREIEQDIGVRNARQLHENLSNRLRTAETDLPKAITARENLARLTALSEKQGKLVSTNALRRTPLEGRIYKLDAEIEHFEARLKTNVTRVEGDLDRVRAQIRQNESTIKPAGGGSGHVDASRASRLEGLKMKEAEIKENLADLAKSPEAREIAQRQAERAALKRELDEQPGWQELIADQARTRKELADTRVQLHQLEDVSADQVARLQGLAGQAAHDLNVARVAGRQRVQRELDTLNEQIADIRTKLKKLDAGATQPILPVAIVQTVLGPIAITYEKAFGAGDSPEEIVRTLMKNKSDVLEELKELTRARAAAEEWTKVRMPETYTRLQSCLVANRPATTAPSAAQ